MLSALKIVIKQTRLHRLNTDVITFLAQGFHGLYVYWNMIYWC